MKVWLNNRIMDQNRATIPLFDRGFLYGDGVFETMRTYGGKIFKADRHLDRLYRSLKITEIKVPYSRSFLKNEIYKLLKKNKLKDAYIRLAVTRGAGRVGLSGIKCENPTIAIVANKLTPYPEVMYKKGISVKVASIRQNENSPISGMKSLSFMNYILARLEAKKSGFDDALMLNSRKEISEATVSNIFIVKGRKLLTPPLSSGILPGITRGVILEIAPKAGLTPYERALEVPELYRADEVFLTNSIMEIMPVIRINNRLIGNGVPGTFTERLALMYRSLLLR
ncbi:MAG: aminotransferase class IV [Candidatus Omnitrophica bacterium]|nr:aminotransferase class IV [Candidatus Omnitrophota bacterium]